MRQATFLQVLLGFTFWMTAAVAIHAEDVQPKSGADADSLLSPWRNATEAYKEARDKAQSLLLRSLDVVEEKARSTGDLDKVNALKQEKTQFEELGVLPTSVKTAAYEKSMNNAKSTLRAVAKRVKTSLVKQKLDEDAKALEEELAKLTGTEGQQKDGRENATLAGDDRTFWKTKHDKEGDQLLMVKPGEWIQTAPRAGPWYFKELARTPEYIELHDEDRKIGIRLKAASADVHYYFKPGKTADYEIWHQGRWFVDPPDVVYLAELKEKAFKVWDYLGNRKSGWSNNGQIEKERIFIDSRPSIKGIYTHPEANGYATVKYDIAKLNKQFFRAKVGIADRKHSNSETPLTFVVLGDGKALFTSMPIQEWNVFEECEVKIHGVKDLELRVKCPGGAGSAFAVWFEPRLTLE